MIRLILTLSFIVSALYGSYLLLTTTNDLTENMTQEEIAQTEKDYSRIQEKQKEKESKYYRIISKTNFRSMNISKHNEILDKLKIKFIKDPNEFKIFTQELNIYSLETKNITLPFFFYQFLQKNINNQLMVSSSIIKLLDSFALEMVNQNDFNLKKELDFIDSYISIFKIYLSCFEEADEEVMLNTIRISKILKTFNLHYLLHKSFSDFFPEQSEKLYNRLKEEGFVFHETSSKT